MRILEEHLQKTREALLMMAREVTGSVRNAISALHQKDEDLARSVLDREDSIDARELEIDEMCMGLLARYQPEASDLRFLITVMQMTNDLERIGDHAVNLSHRALDMIQMGLPPETLEVVAMGEAAAEMLEKATLCFLNRDPQLAEAILASDDAMDRNRDRLFRTIVQKMTDEPHTVEPRLHLLLISRDIERIADLSTNMAEDVYFIITGENLKHRTLRESG